MERLLFFAAFFSIAIAYTLIAVEIVRCEKIDWCDAYLALVSVTISGYSFAMAFAFAFGVICPRWMCG
mgnify:FL=1